MTNKFLTFVGNSQKLLTAIFSSSGIADAFKIVSTNSLGYIDETLLPPSIGADTSIVPTSEELSAGNFVNIYLLSSVPTCRKADASNGRDANGFVLAAVAAGQSATVYRLGSNTQLINLAPGTTYFLSATTSGMPSVNAPTNPGHIRQELGVAFSSGTLVFIDRGFTEIGD